MPKSSVDPDQLASQKPADLKSTLILKQDASRINKMIFFLPLKVTGNSSSCENLYLRLIVAFTRNSILLSSVSSRMLRDEPSVQPSVRPEPKIHHDGVLILGMSWKCLCWTV